MKTPILSVIYYIIAAFLGAFGQYLYKTGAETSGGSVSSYLLNSRLLLGVGCYIGVMVLFVAAFKKGGELQVLYPIYATTFIWAALLSALLFDTQIRPANIIGMALLITGMYLMGK